MSWFDWCAVDLADEDKLASGNRLRVRAPRCRVRARLKTIQRLTFRLLVRNSLTFAMPIE
ncbi:hypothetical protein CGZ80_11090 [Rhodopirellula sp. MGV]|nr:hypothetical protein CGZ80_11090 [Rhodopirellula sp. MGV]PNY35657.1 hypothetical protein C2E31_17120 [Rhodopirellula baltica]